MALVYQERTTTPEYDILKQPLKELGDEVLENEKHTTGELLVQRESSSLRKRKRLAKSIIRQGDKGELQQLLAGLTKDTTLSTYCNRRICEECFFKLGIQGCLDHIESGVFGPKGNETLLLYIQTQADTNRVNGFFDYIRTCKGEIRFSLPQAEKFNRVEYYYGLIHQHPMRCVENIYFGKIPEGKETHFFHGLTHALIATICVKPLHATPTQIVQRILYLRKYYINIEGIDALHPERTTIQDPSTIHNSSQYRYIHLLNRILENEEELSKYIDLLVGIGDSAQDRKIETTLDQWRNEAKGKKEIEDISRLIERYKEETSQ